MLPKRMKASNRATKKNHPKRFKGICADAIALNVTRVHLWKVLTGRRESKPLLARYRNWKRRQLRHSAGSQHSLNRDTAGNHFMRDRGGEPLQHIQAEWRPKAAAPPIPN